MTRLLLVALTTGVALIAASPAHADPADNTYYTTLTRMGFDISDYALMSLQGLRACNRITDGADPVAELTAPQNGYTEQEATEITAAAIIAYCPWNRP